MRASSLKYKRLLFVITFVMLSAWQSFAFADGDVHHWIFIETKNGITNTFTLHNRATITIEKDQLVIRSSEFEASYQKSQVKRYFTATDGDYLNSIDDITTQNISIERTADGNILVSGIPEGELITVYGINGVEYHKTTALSVTTVIPLSTLPTGIYILSTDKLGNIKVIR